MASMMIRGIDDSLKSQLRLQAAQHGCSMEEEVREILQSALYTPPLTSGSEMLKRIRGIVEPLGGVNLDLPAREEGREPPEFS